MLLPLLLLPSPLLPPLPARLMLLLLPLPLLLMVPLPLLLLLPVRPPCSKAAPMAS